MSRNKQIDLQQELKSNRQAGNSLFHSLPSRKVHDVREKRSEMYFENTELEREQMMNRMVRTPRNVFSLIIYFAINPFLGLFSIGLYIYASYLLSLAKKALVLNRVEKANRLSVLAHNWSWYSLLTAIALAFYMPLSFVFFIADHVDAVKAGIPIDVVWDLDQLCDKQDENACICLNALSSLTVSTKDPVVPQTLVDYCSVPLSSLGFDTSLLQVQTH